MNIFVKTAATALLVSGMVGSGSAFADLPPVANLQNPGVPGFGAFGGGTPVTVISGTGVVTPGITAGVPADGAGVNTYLAANPPASATITPTAP